MISRSIFEASVSPLFSPSPIDVAASQELKDRMLYEYRGHCLLEACRQADLSKVKKFLSSSSNSSAYVAELLAFKHPYSGDNAVHCAVVSPFPKRKAIGEFFFVKNHTFPVIR